MTDRKKAQLVLKRLLVIFAVGFLAIYFRTYALHGGPIVFFVPSPLSLAQTMVEQALKAQLQDSVLKDFPNLSDQEKARILESRMERLKVEDKTQYENAVAKAAFNFQKQWSSKWKPYLLEADPYHYFYQTEQLLEKGFSVFRRKAGKVFQPMMRAPHGYWEPFLLHPYVGVFWYQIAKIINPHTSLMEALCFLPLIFVCMVLLLFFVFGNILRFSFFANAVAVMTLLLSPVFIQRSALGWYDTDSYNFIFPFLVLGSLFFALRKRRIMPGAIAAAFFTGLYPLFWSGWSFLFVLMPATLLASTFFLSLLHHFKPQPMISDSYRFVGVYFLSAAGFLTLFLTPAGFADSIQMGWATINQFTLSKADVWPNIFLTVGEAAGITLNKLIFLTCNYITFALAMLGILLEGRRAFKEKDLWVQMRFVFFVFFSIPLLVMSLKTERFSLLFVLPLSVFMCFAASRIPEMAEMLLGRYEKFFAHFKVLARPLLKGLFLLVFLPGLFLLSHVVATGIRPIMDDVWYEALMAIKAETPENAIINSWWPPGYFITAIAHRRVTMDGGTQNFHEPVWMAKALIAPDERKAAGVLRMLNLSGDDALEKLQGWGMNVAEGFDLILNIVPLKRQEAFLKLPANLTEEQKNTLLDLTHGRGEFPPTYVFLYDDLIKQNLAVSVLEQWDFRRAQEIQDRKKNKFFQTEKKAFGSDRGFDYVQDMIRVTGPWMKYTPVSNLSRRRGDVLFFENGVQLDLVSKEASVFLPAQGVQKKPKSVFYMEGNELKEKTYSEDIVDFSALVFEDDGSWYSLLADARLIRSLLFRLYYLQGQGMSLFRPVILKGSLSGGTVVRIFALDQDRF